jgi:hypothetical protein
VNHAYSKKRNIKAKQTLLIPYIGKIKVKGTLLNKELKDRSETNSAYSRNKKDRIKQKTV